MCEAHKLLDGLQSVIVRLTRSRPWSFLLNLKIFREKPLVFVPNYMFPVTQGATYKKPVHSSSAELAGRLHPISACCWKDPAGVFDSNHKDFANDDKLANLASSIAPVRALRIYYESTLGRQSEIVCQALGLAPEPSLEHVSITRERDKQ